MGLHGHRRTSRRITVLFPVTDLARDGAQRQLLELAKGLDKQRFRPIVLTLHSGGALHEEFSGVPGAELLSLNQRNRFDLSALVKVFNIIRTRQVDVVQPFLTPATLFGLLPATLSRRPVRIVTERLGLGRSNARLGYRIYLKIEDLLSRLADWAIPNSEAGKEFLIQRGIGRERLRVIYNGIDLERLRAADGEVRRVRQQLALPPGGKVVGVAARLHPQKRHDAFLRAAAIISRALPDTRFAIVGDGPRRSPLEQLARDLGLADKAVFFGEQRDVGSYIAAFDLAVLTSETEGCSNSILEAMASGKPVVATDVGGNRELVDDGETGFLVPMEDDEGVARAAVTILKDPELARSMGERARARVISHFSVDVMVQRYQSLYEETLEMKRGLKGQGAVLA